MIRKAPETPSSFEMACRPPQRLAHTEEHASAFVMAGLVPAIPMLTSTALQAIKITGTRPVMTGAGLPVLHEPASSG
jgi:hypothetical protein